MAWFRGDDKLHGHKKTRRALRHPEKRRDASPMGVWVLAGTWSADNNTGGFIPAFELDRFDDDGEDLAMRLVDAGFWHQATVDGEKGYQFHDWDIYNPDQATVEAKRAAESEGGQRGNHIRWHVNRGVAYATCEFCVLGGDSAPDQVPETGGESGANPPSPVPSRSPSQSARANTITEDGLTRIAEATNSNHTHARKVARDVLAKAKGDVKNPLRYILRAIQSEPQLYVLKRGNPRKDQECPTHAGQWRDACGGCASDAKAAS